MNDAAPASEMNEILDIVSHGHAPMMVLQVPSLVITAASPGAHELLDPDDQPLIGRSLRDFTESQPSDALPLLVAGQITGYETVQVIKATGLRRRLWISTLPDTAPTAAVIALLLEDEANARALVSHRDRDAASPVIGSADAHLMVERVSTGVYESLGYHVDEVIGTSFLALIVPEDVADVLSSIAQTIRNRSGVALHVGVVGADLVPVTCHLALLPLTPAPSCAFALTIDAPDGSPADGPGAVDLISLLGREIRAAMTSEVAAPAPLSSAVDLRYLSSRELEIVTQLMAGDRVSSIAKRLFLSEGTVRNHLSSVFGKLGVGTQQELIELLRPAAGPRR